MLEQIMNVFREMEIAPSCINCHKPFAEGDEGVGGMDGLFRICTPCEEARQNLMNKVQEGLTVTYRDGTQETIGGNTVNPYGLRLFRVGNTGKLPSWVFAEDTNEAKEIFFDNSSTRKMENVRIIKEHLIAEWENRSDINEVNVKGVGVVRMDGMGNGGTWIVSDKGQRLKG